VRVLPCIALAACASVNLGFSVFSPPFTGCLFEGTTVANSAANMPRWLSVRWRRSRFFDATNASGVPK
jgi:hypothetical protein